MADRLIVEPALSVINENIQNFYDLADRFCANKIQTLRGEIGTPNLTTKSKLEQAFTEKNARLMWLSLNHIWLRAPEDRNVYKIPGFKELSALCSGEIPGLIEPYEYKSDED